MRKIIETVEVGSSRLYNLPWNRRGLLTNVQKGQFWKNKNGNELTGNIEEAFVFKVQEIRAFVLTIGRTTINLFDDVPANGRKCLIEQVLHPVVVELLKLAPTNEISRAHALNQLTVPIPNECQTFEQVKDWIEVNIEPSSVRRNYSTVTPAPIIQDTPNINTGLPGPTDAITGAFRVVVERTEMEHGICRFHRPRSGSADVVVTRDEIENIVSGVIEGGGHLGEVVQGIEEMLIDETEIETTPDDDDYDYDDFDTQDTSDINVTLNSDRLREMVINYLRNNNPEAYNTLTTPQ